MNWIVSDEAGYVQSTQAVVPVGYILIELRCY